MDNQTNRGRLIVLPFRGTLDEFFKQLKEGSSEMDIATLASIGLSLQEAYNNQIGINEVKICCLGDLNDKDRLCKLNITKEDLGTIYIVGHGGIRNKEGYATLFNGHTVVNAREIAKALGRLFVSCNYKMNEKIDSKVIINCCYGAAKKCNDKSVLSIAKAIEGEVKRLQFKFEASNIKGGEELTTLSLSNNCKKVLLLDHVPENKKLFLHLIVMKSVIGSHVKNYFEPIFHNSVSNLENLRVVFSTQFKTEFTQMYRNTEGDVTGILAWLKNVAVSYSKWENRAGVYAFAKLNNVPSHKGDVFTKEEEELKKLRLELEQLINFDKGGVDFEEVNQVIKNICETAGIPECGVEKWTKEEVQKAIEQMFKNINKSLTLKAGEEKKDDNHLNDNNKQQNTIQQTELKIESPECEESPSEPDSNHQNINFKTIQNLKQENQQNQNLIHQLQQTNNEIRQKEELHYEHDKSESFTLEEILSSSKNLTEALRKASNQVLIPDQKLSKEQLNGLVKIATEKLQSISQQDRDQVDELALEVIRELLKQPYLSLDTKLVSQSYVTAQETLQEIQETVRNQQDVEQEIEYNDRFTMS